MSTTSTQKPTWRIDQKLNALIGEDVRVAAKSFSPAIQTGGAPPRFIPVGDLFLPDNSQPAGLPVFFEGRLRKFERQIGVVVAWLDSPALPDGAAEGPAFFRGKTAVMLRGPAVVELAWPFQVERLPSDPANYWRDLRVPRAQFEFPFATDGEDGRRAAASLTGLQTRVSTPASVQFSPLPERRLGWVDTPLPSGVDRLLGMTPQGRNDAGYSEGKTKH